MEGWGTKAQTQETENQSATWPWGNLLNLEHGPYWKSINFPWKKLQTFKNKSLRNRPEFLHIPQANKHPICHF